MKEIINVTDITAYMFCPRKLWLKKVKGIREPPSKPMINGMVKHKALEIFNLLERQFILSLNQKLTKQELDEKYKQIMRTSALQAFQLNSNVAEKFSIGLTTFLAEFLPTTEKELKLRAKTLFPFITKGLLGRELWNNLTPKYQGEFKITSDELGIKGRVDRVSFGSEIIPYEIKTRKSGEIYQEDEIQLAAYALLLEDKFNRKISKGILELPSETKEIQITEESKKQVLDIADKVRNLSSSEPEMLSRFNKCRSCRISKQCLGD